MILKVTAFTALGAAVAFAGFAIGQALGDDPSVPEFSQPPSTLSQRPAAVAIPGFSPATDSPVLATTVETAAAAPSGDEGEGGESATAFESAGTSEESPAQVEGTKDEGNAAPKKEEPAPPKGDITVGPLEE